MAKMFYSLEEAAAKLGKPEGEVREMASRGEITEFRDGDKLIFKVDQINLLAGDDEADAGLGDEMIPLSDTGGGSGSAISGLDLADTGGGSQTGISIFDADELEEADPAAQTQVTDTDLEGVDLESFGSGSGLMDMTREADDTSLGATGLLDELYPADEEAEAAGEALGGSGLFEGGPAESESLEPARAEAAGAMVLAAEAYDGRGSGLTGGFALGMLLAAALGVAVMFMGMFGPVPDFFSTTFNGNMLVWLGILAGATVVFGVVGFLLGGKS